MKNWTKYKLDPVNLFIQLVVQADLDKTRHKLSLHRPQTQYKFLDQNLHKLHLMSMNLNIDAGKRDNHHKNMCILSHLLSFSFHFCLVFVSFP
ncbi:MAG TPA: hypothetical protein DD671_19025 [Balneolaceae bacterium]|nr:hypothetical protein [Balneolaceae bacterium]